MQLVANGQLADSTSALYTGISPVQAVVVLQNTSNSSSETVLLTLTPSGGTARRIARAVLAANEQLVLSGVPLNVNDVLKGHATDASTVDYTVSTTATDIPYSLATLDGNGALKQVNSGLTGDQTVSGNVTAGTAFLPDANDGASLGTNTLSFADLYVASTGTINFGDSNLILTHSSGLLTNNKSFASGNSAADLVTVKGFYMNATNTVVAVPSITDPDVAKVDVSVAASFTVQPAIGDAVIALPQEALPTNARLQGAWVSGTDQVTITFGSEGGNVTGANTNFKFLIFDLT